MRSKNQYQLVITTPHHSYALYLLSCLLYILTQNNISTLHIRCFDLPLRIKKFILLKSPHVHKTARTQLELRTSQKIICIENISSYEMEVKLVRILKYLMKYLPVSTKVTCKHLTQHTF